MNIVGRIKKLFSIKSEYSCLIILFVVLLTSSILSSNFFTFTNLTNVFKQASVVCVVAIGMGTVLISGCMDMTVGINMAICAIVSMLLQTKVNIFLTILLTLLCGLTISLLNYLVVYITKAKGAQIMMITFGLKMAYRGLTQAFTGNITFREETTAIFEFIGKGNISLIPNIIFITLLVTSIFQIVISEMRYGRELKYIGYNEEASRLSGINTEKTRMMAFVISGLCCAVAGILLASRTKAVNALSGDGYEIDAMCGLIIGGYSISGGYGSPWCAIVGVFIYSAIKNILNLMGVSAYGQQLAQGIILLVAVWADVFIKQKRGKG